MTTHILYLTSRCNLACKYCYEHLKKTNQFDLTLEDAKKNIDLILSQDSEPVIVLFGGEPTLRWDMCAAVSLYAFGINPKVYFSLCTNGTRFKSDSMCQEFLKLKNSIRGQISLDVSFDGVGNYLRTYKNGKQSTETIYKVFKNLKKHGIPFNIRYTVHPETVELSKLDIPNIASFIKPEKIILSFDNVSKKDFTLESEIGIPVCDLTCNTCKQCIKGNETLYWSHAGNIRVLRKGENASAFKDFELA